MAMLRVRGLFVPVRTLALLLSEVVVMAVAFYMFVVPADGYLAGSVEAFGDSAGFGMLLVGLTVVTMVAVGLYNAETFLDYRSMLARVVVVLALEGPVIFAATFLYKDLVFP